ncbi:tetratricopeptide repeat protein [Planctomicrobium piriforme]|nr:tetratricopeptide repeat protein [Planctomicrobium piriforme]
MLEWFKRFCACLLLFGVFVNTAAADPVTDYNVAVEFYKQQRWQPAADACQEFIQKYPTHERAATARLYWAQSLLHLKKYREARDQFEQFLKATPDHPDRPLAMYRVGESSYFLGDDAAVETQFEQFLKLYPNHELAEWALLYLGEAQFRLKHYDAAAKTFERSLAAYPQGRLVDDVEFDLAGVYDALGKKEQASALLQKIAGRTASTRSAEAMFQMGARAFDEQKYDQAASTFTQLATLHPQHRLTANAQLNAGYALYYLGRYADAIKAFGKAAADPQLAPTAAYWTGLSQKSLREYAAAAKTLADSLQSQPDQSLADKVTFHLADAEFRQGNYDKAIELFQKVSANWPKSDLGDDSLHSACEAALQAGQLPKAVELHEQFVKAFPDSGLRVVEDLLYARVLIAQGEKNSTPDAARKDYDQAAAILQGIIDQSSVDRTRNFARFQLARVYERREDNQKVIEILRPLLDSPQAADSPDYLDARLLSANAHLRLKDNSAAAEDYRQYLAKAATPADKVVGLAGLARALTATKDWKQLQTVLPELRSADAADAQFSRAAMAAGDAAFDQKDWPASQEFFRLVIARGESGAFYLPALSGLAHAQYEQQQFTASAAGFATLAAAAKSDPLLNSHAAYMHAMTLQQAGESKDALLAYQSAADKLTQRQKMTPLAGTDVEVGMNAYRCEKGAARLARELGDRTLADKLYDAAYAELKLQPKENQKELDLLINEWANLAYTAEDYPRADELYARLVADTPESPLANEALLILGESARFGGQPDKAIQLFQKLADNPKADPFIRQRALVHLLDLAAETGRWNDALTIAERLKKEFPDGPHASYAMYRQGEALLQLKQYAKSAEVLHELISKPPASQDSVPVWWPETWLLLAEDQYWLKDYSRLEQVVADLKQKQPSPSVLYRADALLGRSLENRARFIDAREAYIRVIDSEAGRGTETAAEAQFRIAESYLKENNLPVALREYYKVYAGYDAPKLEAAALFQAASCDVSMKHFTEAMGTYRKLIEEFPNSEFTDQAKSRLKELEVIAPKG